jgi:hypothetical protein
MSVENTVSNSLDEFWQYFESGEFDQGLKTFSEFNISEEVADFTFNPDSYYVPNKRNDTFVKPKGVSEELIPILGIEDANQYRFSRPSVHALQRIALKNANFDLVYIDEVFNSCDNTVSRSSGSAGSASVYNHRLYIPAKEAVVESKPNVILNLERSGEDYLNTCAGVILHELVHVAQSLNQPWYEEDRYLQKELEAYAVQNCLLYSLTVPYSLSTAMASSVDSFRKRHLGDNVFTPTKEFEALMAQTDSVKNILKSD